MDGVRVHWLGLKASNSIPGVVSPIYPALFVSCSEQARKPILSISVRGAVVDAEYIGYNRGRPSVRPRIRFDDGKAVAFEWSVTEDLNLLQPEIDVQSVLRDIEGATVFRMEIPIDREGRPIVRFDVAGLTPRLDQFAEECGWQRSKSE